MRFDCQRLGGLARALLCAGLLDPFQHNISGALAPSPPAMPEVPCIIDALRGSHSPRRTTSPASFESVR